MRLERLIERLQFMNSCKPMAVERKGKRQSEALLRYRAVNLQRSLGGAVQKVRGSLFSILRGYRILDTGCACPGKECQSLLDLLRRGLPDILRQSHCQRDEWEILPHVPGWSNIWCCMQQQCLHIGHVVCVLCQNLGPEAKCQLISQHEL